MTGKKKKSEKAQPILSRRHSRAPFPSKPPATGLPADYANLLSVPKRRISEERLRVVLGANAAMILLYWDIGQIILDRQNKEGWGTKVIDRLSADLRQAFPDMQGLSPRNLKYMRAFAAAWPNREIVQQTAAQIPWFHNIALLDNLKNAETGL